MSRDSLAPLRAGFVMEQVLGHVTHYHTLRRVLAENRAVEPHWVEVTYEGAGRLERATRIPAAARSTFRGFLQVREGLRARRFDALLFHTQKPAVFQWDLMARVPTVLSLDVTPRQYDALGAFYNHSADADTAVARLKHSINRRTFGLARVIVAWSNWVKESLVTDYGVPPSKVRVIPPGIDLSLWMPATDLVQRNRRPRVLFVGGDFERKGGPLLLDWFRMHGRDVCEVDLVTRADVRPEPGLRVHRNVTGNSDQARRLFRDADVFVLPSLGECFGIASAEAMAAGLPVVTTRVGGADDIVEHGETGFLIPPNDPSALAEALDRLLTDPALRCDLGRRGRQRATALFSASTNAQALVACLAEAAG